MKDSSLDDEIAEIRKHESQCQDPKCAMNGHPVITEQLQSLITKREREARIDELEHIMDYADEPVHLNFDTEINPIMVGERIKELEELNTSEGE